MYPILHRERVRGAADGLKQLFQQPQKYLIQNWFYKNGWKSAIFVNSVLVFAPDDVIKMCTLNCPGTWHNSHISEYGVYKKMEEVDNRYNVKIVVSLLNAIILIASSTAATAVTGTSSSTNSSSSSSLLSLSLCCSSSSSWGSKHLAARQGDVFNNQRLLESQHWFQIQVPLVLVMVFEEEDLVVVCSLLQDQILPPCLQDHPSILWWCAWTFLPVKHHQAYWDRQMKFASCGEHCVSFSAMVHLYKFQTKPQHI